MERRTSVRMMVDLPSWSLLDGHRHPCRAVDLSTTGMVIERTRGFTEREPPQLGLYELKLGEGDPIRLRARTVRWDGRYVAVRFVVVNPADRLTIAEHADSLSSRPGLLH